MNGTSLGFDFNPVRDRIRLTSDADQHLRLNPNDGTLNTVGSLSPGFDISGLVGFDIFFDNRAFASLTPTTSACSSLFSINLTTGAATLIGLIGSGRTIAGIAIQQDPEPAAITLLAAALLGSVAVRARRRLK